MHKCNTEEWQLFPDDVSAINNNKLSYLKNKNMLFCIDEKDMLGNDFWTPENKNIYGVLGS